MLSLNENIVKQIRHAGEKIANGMADVVVCSTGAPGAGKSLSALQVALEREHPTTVLSPNHAQAAERSIEAGLMQIGHNQGRLRHRHVTGIGRKCKYTHGDQWTPRGYHFHEAACPGCSNRSKCDSYKQFYRPPDVILGVHQQADTLNRGLQILDECPNIVSTTTMPLEDVARLCAPTGDLRLERWRKHIEIDLRIVYDELLKLAQSTRADVHDTEIAVRGVWAKTHPIHGALQRLTRWLDDNPAPLPSPERVRVYGRRDLFWPDSRLNVFVRSLLDSVSGESCPELQKRQRVTLNVRRELGETADDDRLIVTWVLRQRRELPTKPHMVLDSTYSILKDVYAAAYEGRELQVDSVETELPHEHIQQRHYNTLAFARKRLFRRDGKQLRSEAIPVICRMLDECYLQLCRIRRRLPGNTKPEIGLILARPLLAIFRKKGVGGRVVDAVKRDWAPEATNPQIEKRLRRLRQHATLHFGYYGAVLGSNSMRNVSIIAGVGDPVPNIGAAGQEAQLLGLDPTEYIAARTAATATQAIFRARLLDATAESPKLVLYFGRTPPEHCGLEGRWESVTWAAGGPHHSFRRTGVVGRALTLAGDDGTPLVVPTNPILDHLQLTPSKAPLQELAGDGRRPSPATLTPAERELVRVSYEQAGEVLGYEKFRIVNPVPGAYPLTVWARRQADAEDVVADIAQELKLRHWEKPPDTEVEPVTEALADEAKHLVKGARSARKAAAACRKSRTSDAGPRARLDRYRAGISLLRGVWRSQASVEALVATLETVQLLRAGAGLVEDLAEEVPLEGSAGVPVDTNDGPAGLQDRASS